MHFHEIKAFTKTGMNVLGNPATVTVVDQFPSDQDMGAAAKKLGTPMTTFLCPTDSPGTFDIRHFSPDGDECHICGHATLAAAAFLARENAAFSEGAELTFNMNPKFGVSKDSTIKVHIQDNEISLMMPAITQLVPMKDAAFYQLLCQGLGVSEDALLKPVYFAKGIKDLVVAFKDQNTLLSLMPDFPKLKQMAIEGAYPHEGLMGTAPSNIPGFDVINRVFLPGIDVNEDIACGSGNCSIIPFWVLRSQGVFPPDKRDFKVVYPYPPGPEGYVGGVQQIHMDVESQTITLTGQARYERAIDIPMSGRRPPPKNVLGMWT